MQLNTRFGDYVLLRKIATGGMAEVHLALKRGPGVFDRLVALKTILPHRHDSQTFIDMFYNEARIGARFNHSNLVNVFDVEVIEDSLTMVMEYVAGTTVADLVLRAKERNVPFRRPPAIRIVLDACQGLHHAHHLRDIDGSQMTVVHRDVSPQNILVGYNGQVKVFDFGIAHTVGGNGAKDSLAGVLAGKYAYMSPEQCAGADLDERSDVFSLGIMLWELTTQKRLFRRKNQIDVLRAITEEAVPKPSSVASAYPRGLERVVMAALARDPNKRPASALELHDALLKYAALADEQMSSTRLGGFVEEVFPDEAESERAFLALALEQVEELEMTETAQKKAVAEAEREATIETPIEDDDDDDEDDDVGLEALIESAVSEADFALTHSGGYTAQALEGTLTEALRRSRRLNVGLIAVVVLLLIGSAGAALIAVSNGNGAPTAAAATPEQAELSIASEPAGATIYVNGVERADVTPATVAVDLERVHDVRLELAGHRAALARVATSADSPSQNLRLFLTPVPTDEGLGVVRVVTQPPDATVTIDEQTRGRGTPLLVRGLALGEPHVLLVQRDGFEDRRMPFELTSGATREIQLELTPAVELGRLTISTEPIGAQVLIDGELAGLTPLEALPLVSGREFNVELQLEGYRSHRTTVSLAPDEVQEISERLSRHRRREDRDDEEAEEAAPATAGVDVAPVVEEVQPEDESPYELLP